MPWGDNGVTNFREMLDQSPAFVWGGQGVPINFNPINNVGYLRRLWLKIPQSTANVTLAATGNTVASAAEKDWPIGRGIGQVSLIAQGIAPLYQLLKGGLDLEYLAFFGNGREPWDQYSVKANSSNAATNVAALGHTTDQWQARNGVIVGAQAGAGPFTQAVTYAATYDLPITEWVLFPAGQMQDAQGKTIYVPAQWQEVGLLTAQNTQQNLRLSAMMNPMYTLTGGTYDTLLKATTAIPTASAWAGQFSVYSEFYDVPPNPADQPPDFTQNWVITRQTRDWPVAGNNVFPKFEPAGLLMRAIYVFLDANDQVIDISGQATDGTISFKWGASVYKYLSEPFEMHLQRQAENYNAPLPSGCLVHDFFRRRTLTDLVNTATLTSVSAEIRGLPAAVTNCHVIEERMVPVRS